MKKITLDEFNELLAQTTIKPRLRKELRFVNSTESMSNEEWTDRELLNITDRSGNNGVLIVSLTDNLYIMPYELKTGITSSATGRSQSIICDFCQTWQYGNRSGSITFPKNRDSNISYIVCADLKCSLHVRNKTEASHTSRSQLREDLTIEQRIERLESRMARFISELPFDPIKTT
ncbi:MAG: FBP domain-containing protein [Patescibacteria group bacterium]